MNKVFLQLKKYKNFDTLWGIMICLVIVSVIRLIQMFLDGDSLGGIIYGVAESALSIVGVVGFFFGVIWGSNKSKFQGWFMAIAIFLISSFCIQVLLPMCC